ncbi:uncharacterized protein [Parasteatoda tepidariorum]|uniref:uncharacterized protein n=1 Tax=Parasteatoda tepidariorum TaxID=114398 RepID=UPI00077FB200|nr:ADP-ribosylation factor-like protein 3 [Parasteatoda tepidariorum]
MNDFFNYFSRLSKPVIIAGGCSVMGFSAFAIYSYFKHKRRMMIDEGFVDQNVVDESINKVLVLGLEGSGKSTFLSHLAKIDGNIYEPDNTKEFNVLSVVCHPHKSLNFWEIGGSKSHRVYWSNFVQDTDLLVYVVDAADEHKLAESVKELHILIACDKLKNVPIFILANKQDLKNAFSPMDIADAFEVPELTKYYKIAVHPLEMPPDAQPRNESVMFIKNVISYWLSMLK